MQEPGVTHDQTALRAEVRAWAQTNWDPGRPVRDWWRLLVDSGWGFPTWPRAWFGKELSADDSSVVLDELAQANVLGPPIGAGPSMAVPMLLAFGSEAQKQRWIPALAYGEEYWAQFFSEPGAGSDLAAVQARAVRDGDEWVVNGQKVWNSCTRFATRALLVARTDVDVAKHRGIGFFILDIDQPGIDIRPIKQMNGLEEFNEAFITDARLPDEQRIGAADGGWAIAMNVLQHERENFPGGGSFVLRQVEGGARFGYLDRTCAEVMAVDREFAKIANGLPIGTPDAVIALARQYGRLGDPVIRQRIASLYSLCEALRLTGLRGQANAKAGKDNAESSIVYLGGVLVARRCRDLVADIAGAAAMLAGTDVAETITIAPAHGIQGGTEQIQRNVIGERLLGLPREPQVDRDVPFRLLKVGTQRG